MSFLAGFMVGTCFEGFLWLLWWLSKRAWHQAYTPETSTSAPAEATAQQQNEAADMAYWGSRPVLHSVRVTRRRPRGRKHRDYPPVE